MFCSNCGAEVSGGKFCPKCGTPITEEEVVNTGGTMKLDQTEKQTAPEGVSVQADSPAQPVSMPAPAGYRKKKKKKIVPVIIILILLVVLAGGGIIAYKYYTSPVKQFAAQLEQGNIDTAIMYLDQIDEGTKQQEAVDVLVSSAQETYNNFLAEAMEYSEASRMISKINDALEDNKDIAEIAEKLESLNESRIAYGLAVKLQDSAKYADAIAEYEKVIEEDTYYDMAQQAVSDCMDLCREDTLSQAAVYEQNGMYDEAISVLDVALAILPNDTSLISERKLCESMLEEKAGEAALEEAKKLVGDGNDANAYKAARDVLKEYLEKYPSDAAAARKRDEYDNAYFDGSLNKAWSLVQAGDYDEAIALLRGLEKEYPSRTDIGEIIAMYESYRPVDLQTFEIYESVSSSYGLAFDTQQTAKDTWDNTWDNCVTMRNLYGSGYYQLGYLIVSKYNHFHCVLACEQTQNTKGEGYVEVYMDNELIYRSESIDRSTKPITVDMDLPEGQIFTIKFQSSKNERLDLIMAEPSLSNVG